MPSNFDVNKYWLSRGRTYQEESRTPAEYHRLQEQFLLAVLERARIPMRRVLELGCGFGRITKLLAERWPDAEITALDLSPEQLTNARRHCGENPRLHFARFDFYSGAPLPGSDYDAVVAIEVFLHHPPEIVVQLLKQSAAVARCVVNVDWSEDWKWPTPEHVWVHDYAQLASHAGLQSIAFAVPEKIDGKQQKLFITAKELPPHLRGLGCSLPDFVPGRRCPDVLAADDWDCQLRQAMTELAGAIPRGSSIILVDDAQWGDLAELDSCLAIPFLEKDGVYWGPPDSDATAWQELERMRKRGAHFIAFAWSSFWWLQHYAEFHQLLRAHFRCVLENERLVVFSLKN